MLMDWLNMVGRPRFALLFDLWEKLISSNRNTWGILIFDECIQTLSLTDTLNEVV